MTTVERTDFVSVPVQDLERAKRFYGETLGIPSPDLEAAFPEKRGTLLSAWDSDDWETLDEDDDIEPHHCNLRFRITVKGTFISVTSEPATECQ